MGATPVPVPAPPPAPFWDNPDTMSSILKSIAADSTAVLMLCTFTAYASQIPSSFMSTIVPLLPSIPKVQVSPVSLTSACFARNLVSVRITFAPQFCARVRGITSSACPIALNGHCSTPSIFSASSVIARLTAISTAPPPGNNRGSCTTFRATPMASWRLRSTSFNTSRDAPRRIMEHALGSSQSTKKEKYSSPSFSTLNNPAPVPMSSSLNSSTRCTIVAPVALAILLLSVLRTRLNATIPALHK
mmetsp:Transcript_5198/g.19448  ORF Transcript_5198/g.19448 Transcript_5198/m.19448 type:complete len:246 (-) Transcript_5198:983-1720(-)